MHHACSHCELIYEREVSFFYGAMYISYGLMVGWFAFWYVLLSFFIDIDLFWFLLCLSASIILLSPLNLRLSRLIWLNLFFRYDKRFAALT